MEKFYGCVEKCVNLGYLRPSLGGQLAEILLATVLRVGALVRPSSSGRRGSTSRGDT